MGADHRDVARQLIVALSKVRHAVFIHETTLTGDDDSWEMFFEDEESYYEYLTDRFGWPRPAEARIAVNELLQEHGITVIPYRTNAELSVLAGAFIDENEKNLIFRLYVPNGRIYAAEADKLLSMFREWLTQAQRQRVRQDGYRTGSGQVYEFYGDDTTSSRDLTTQFDDFSHFLELCVDQPDDAHKQLTEAGVDPLIADDIVRRYGKETRRLHLDLKHAREARLLSIRQRLESELVDVLGGDSPEWGEINRMVEAAVPEASNLVAALAPASVESVPVSQTQVTINQQIIHSVEGTVLQGLQGTLNLGPEAKGLLELVSRFGDSDAAMLESAVHELEDEDATQADRLRAKQRLKGFLFKLGGKVEDTGLAVLQKYIEGKLGL